MRLQPWFAILIILFSLCPSLRADEDHATTAATSATLSSGNTDRNTADPKLQEYVLDFLWKAFPKLTKDQLKERFETTLPTAMNEARDDQDGKSCGKLTALMIPLLGTYADHSETENLLKEIGEAEKQDNNRAFPDRSFRALLTRLKWMAGDMKGEPNEKYPEFNKCFNDEFDAYQKKQDEFWAKVNDAANGANEATRKEALQYIASHTVPGELKKFLETFAPQAEASTNPRLKKWAENLQKAAPELEKLNAPPPAAQTTGQIIPQPPRATGTPAEGAGAPQSGGGQTASSAQPPTNDPKEILRRLGEAQAGTRGTGCRGCHETVEISGTDMKSFRVAVTGPGSGAPRTFKQVLESGMAKAATPAMLKLLSNWVKFQ